MNIFGTIFRVLGVVAGGVSLFILSESVFELERSQPIANVVGIYQALIYPIAGSLERPFQWLLDKDGWSVPADWREWMLLYLVFAAVLYRALSKDSAKGHFSLAGLISLTIFVLVSLLWPLYAIYYTGLHRLTPGGSRHDEYIAKLHGEPPMFEAESKLAATMTASLRQEALFVLIVSGFLVGLNSIW